MLASHNRDLRTGVKFGAVRDRDLFKSFMVPLHLPTDHYKVETASPPPNIRPHRSHKYPCRRCGNGSGWRRMNPELSKKCRVLAATGVPPWLPAIARCPRGIEIPYKERRLSRSGVADAFAPNYWSQIESGIQIRNRPPPLIQFSSE